MAKLFGLLNRFKFLIMFIVLIVIVFLISRTKSGKAELNELMKSFNEVKDKDESRIDVIEVEPEEFKRDKVRRSNNKVSKNVNEERCRKIFEDYFDDYFPTVRPNFLKNPKTGRPLELDGYNPRLNLCWEYQGRQHVEYVPRFHKSYEDFLMQVERDQFKARRLQELGIALIEIPHTLKPHELEPFIHKELKRLGYKNRFTRSL